MLISAVGFAQHIASADAATLPPLGHPADVQIEAGSTECTYAGGVTAAACSVPGSIYLTAGTPVGGYSYRYEMGHEVDYLMLNDTERAWLAHNWRLGLHPWPDSAGSIAAGNEDQLEGIFPLVYAWCWFHKTDIGHWFQFVPNNPTTPNTDPIAKPRANDCSALRVWLTTTPVAATN